MSPRAIPSRWPSAWALVTFGAVALLICVADLAAKGLAEGWLADVNHPLWGERIRLVLVHNSAGAFGLSLGAYTWHANVALTFAAVVLAMAVVLPLAEYDGTAPHAMGLVAGAALGNLVSLLISPQGVPDFVAIDRGGGHELVLNLADVAAYLGLGILIRTGFVLWSVRGARQSRL